MPTQTPEMIERWHTVHTPDRGLKLDAPADKISERETPGCEEVVIREGVISKAPGAIIYGNTDTKPLKGVVLALYEFKLDDGTTQLIALTTAAAYKYNTGTQVFDEITSVGKDLVTRMTVRVVTTKSLVCRITRG